jgi:hypothetical protein
VREVEACALAITTDRSDAASEISPLAPASADLPAEARQQVLVDDAKALSCYANFCRVTGTPEEVIMDFGLNPQPFGTPAAPIAISERIVCNYYTAKRFLAALQMTVQRHEAAFGALETDVQKRVQAQRRQ